MQGIKKRQDRLYTEDSQNTSKYKITSRLNTAASLSFSQNSGTLEVNSLAKNKQFFVSPRYGTGQQSHYNIDSRLQSIDSSLTLNPQVRETDVRQLMQAISMIKFLVFSNSQQTKYITQKQKSNHQLRLNIEQKKYGVESNKLKIERKRALFFKKRHHAEKLRQQKEHMLDKDIFEMTYSIQAMKRKLTQRSMNKTVLDLEHSKIKAINRKGSHQYFGLNKMYVPIESNQLKGYIYQNPSIRHQEKSYIFPSLQLQSKIDCNKVEQNKYQQNHKEKVETNKEEKKQFEILPNRQRIRDSIRSHKWKDNDDQDEELVQFLSSSIRKTQKQPNNLDCKPHHINQQHEQHQMQSQLKEQQIITFVEDSSSVVNITYESEDKRHSKSQDSKEDTIDPFRQRKKMNTLKQSPVKIDIQMSNSKASPQKRARAVTLNNSPIKIEVQISQSKASSSSRGDISKTNAAFSKFQSYLQEQFQQIDEVSQELASLKNSPLQGKANSSSQRSSNVQLQNIPNRIQETDSLVSRSSAESPLKNPPNLLQVDNISERVQMQYSIISQQQRQSGTSWRKKYLLQQSTGQSEQDILDSINLLHQSRISREKAKKMKDASSSSSYNPNQRERESTLRDSDFGEEIGPLPTQSRVLSKSSGSAIQQSMVRKRSTTVMNRLSEKAGNNKVSWPIEQVQEEQDKLQSD